MRALNISVKDVKGQASDGDIVIVRSVNIRAASEGDSIVTSAPVTVYLNDGVGSVNVEPGPLLVQFKCRNMTDTKPFHVVVPEGEGPVSLKDLLENKFEVPDKVLSRLEVVANRAAAAASAARINADGVGRDAAAAVAAKEAAQAAAEEVKAAVATAEELVEAEVRKQVAALPAMSEVDPNAVTKAVEDHFKKHPVTGGTVTDEQIAAAVGDQIGKQVTAAVAEAMGNEIREAVEAAGDAGVAIVRPTSGTDITEALQAAINNPEKKVIELPAGEWGLSNTVNLDKLSGKVLIGRGDATVLKMKRGVGKNALQSTSGGGIRRASLTGFVIDMDWAEGEAPATALQITNGTAVKMMDVGVMNSGGNAFLLQGFTQRTKVQGNGTSDSRVVNCWVDGAGLKQNTVQQGASGFGILVKDESNRNQILGNNIRGVSCGMGIGGTDTLDEKLPVERRQGAPKDTLVASNSVVMAENASIAFEPCGFTRECVRTNITGNSFPGSFDNGISVGGYSTVTANTINNPWNHGIACSGHHTTISGNIIWNVGKENSTRLRDNPKDWAAVALEDPIGCVVTSNTYAQDDPQADCAHMVKVVIREGSPRSAVGGNKFADNTAQAGTIKKEFIKNGNFNPENPDTIVTDDVWQTLLAKPTTADVEKIVDDKLKKFTVPTTPAPVPAAPSPAVPASPLLAALATREGPVPGKDIHPFNLWLRGGRRLSPVSYSWPNYWSAVEEAGGVWANYLHNPSIAGPLVMNPRSGFGAKVEEDFRLTLATSTARGYVNIPYVKTLWGDRPHDEVMREIEQYVEGYGRDVLHGVFLDEAVNGWGDQAGKVAYYTELYSKIRTKYGSAFYVVANPGGNTVEGMLDAADTLMSFEQSAARYLTDTLMPAHYRMQNPLRFWHAVHDCPDRATAKQVLNRASVSNVGQIWVTSDTFSGVLGSESPTNNPWDNSPKNEVIDETIQWVIRHATYRHPVFVKKSTG